MTTIINPQALASLIEDAGARATIDPATRAYDFPADIERELAAINIEQLEEFYAGLRCNLTFRRNCLHVGLDPDKLISGTYRATEQPRIAAAEWSYRRANEQARKTLRNSVLICVAIILTMLACRAIDPPVDRSQAQLAPSVIL